MRKHKENKAGNSRKSQSYDRCQTPYYALDPLLPFIKKNWVIWESAAGEGKVALKLLASGLKVITSDLLDGQNFFDYTPGICWDCQITNPPYSIKYQWLKHSYYLGKPFALLLPIDTIGAASSQRLFEKFGVEIILLNKRVNFKMPNKGYNGGGAHFATAWYTYGLGIGQQLTFAKITYYEDEQLPLIA